VTEPLTATELAELRELHHEDHGMCASCVDGPETDYAPSDWPCESGRWLATIDAQRTEIAQLRERLDSQEQSFAANAERWKTDPPIADYIRAWGEAQGVDLGVLAGLVERIFAIRIAAALTSTEAKV